MSAGVQSRSAVRGARSQSLFYRDLAASPATRASSIRGDFNSPNPTTPPLWRENIGGGVDPPPPPFYTLEDRIERSPESTTDLSFRSPESKFVEKNVSFNKSVHSPPSGRGSFGLSYGENHGIQGSPGTLQTPLSGTSNWWAPLKEKGVDNRDVADREGSSPVSGVVQQQQTGGLLTLSAPREVIRPGFFAASVPEKGAEGDEWVTVFGFGVDETNAVLREFEKCGPIVNQVSGPGGANWVHIQYQNYYDAQKALQKNGLQLNGALIVGVKPLDPLQRQAFSDRVNRGGLPFIGLPPRTPSRSTTTPVQGPSGPISLQPTEVGGHHTPRTTAVMASPAKSTLSKLVDLVFGM